MYLIMICLSGRSLLISGVIQSSLFSMAVFGWLVVVGGGGGGGGGCLLYQQRHILKFKTDVLCM